ncbi:hypothetical protein U9M48_010597 [Paspalum notatum var. saurae]|uniref:Uncharacterized protein n=1 Tax=Paspalum notatum var. saurae TaxID=547442 RepID=A0AAQ3STQ6_PASNO
MPAKPEEVLPCLPNLNRGPRMVAKYFHVSVLMFVVLVIEKWPPDFSGVGNEFELHVSALMFMVLVIEKWPPDFKWGWQWI